MNKENLTSNIELFICNSCTDGKEITDDLKKWAKENHPGVMKVFRSGCLGQCENETAALCYPQKEFFLNMKKEDAQEIKDYIKGKLL